MRCKNVIKKLVAIIMMISVIMMNTMGVYAGYSDSTSHHTYAGNTRFFYLLSMEDFAVYAYLSADDQSELSLIGYVEFSLLYDYDRYNFSASDQY